MSKAVWQKLRLTPGKKIILINPPTDYYQLIEWPLEDRPETVEVEADFIHLFTNSVMELGSMLNYAKNRIKSNGVIWISHYKKSSSHKSEIDSAIVRDMAADAGLVDNKICAIDNDWTACRAVIPLKDRPKT